MNVTRVGEISEKVARALGKEGVAGTPIFLGDTNVAHMKTKHPYEYEKYGKYITEILKYPDYVGENPQDGSVEYVKEFVVDGEYVKVAVRVSGAGKYFARSMYVLNRNRVYNFISKGTLKRIDNF